MFSWCWIVIGISDFWLGRFYRSTVINFEMFRLATTAFWTLLLWFTFYPALFKRCANPDVKRIYGLIHRSIPIPTSKIVPLTETFRSPFLSGLTRKTEWTQTKGVENRDRSFMDMDVKVNTQPWTTYIIKKRGRVSRSGFQQPACCSWSHATDFTTNHPPQEEGMWAAGWNEERTALSCWELPFATVSGITVRQSILCVQRYVLSGGYELYLVCSACGTLDLLETENRLWFNVGNHASPSWSCEMSLSLASLGNRWDFKS